MVKELQTMTEFESAKAESNNKLVVVDFFATWCGPCIGCAPKFVALGDKYPDVSFVKVDVDKLGSASQDAGVKAMPTFVLFKGGAKVKEVVGANMKEVENAIVQYK